MMKNQKGITLIALVITIIVLLILAGVSIAMLTGNNGILTRANQAKDENTYAGIQDKVELAIQAVYAETLSPNPSVPAVTESAIAAQYNTDNGAGKATGTNGTNKLTINEDGQDYTVTLDTVGSSKKVVKIEK